MHNTRRLTQLALLIAVELVMVYTPLGMVPVGPFNASLLTIPVAIGAMLLGPGAGAVLGLVFGLTSFWNAVQGKSAMGMALLNANAAGYFVTAVIARVLMGVGTALLFRAVCKALPRQPRLCAVAGGFAAPFLNTCLYMGFIVALFYGSEYVQNIVAQRALAGPMAFIISMVGVQAVVEWGVGCAVAAAVTIPLRKVVKP